MADRESDRVAAVVVTYNRKELLRRGVDSLLGQSRPLDAIYVFDNASTDGTEEMIKQYSAPNLIHLRQTKNLGASGGFYHGMKIAYEAGFDWIWVMDDDVTPAPQCLERMLLHKSEAKAFVPLRITPEGENSEFCSIAAYWNRPGVRCLKGPRVCDLYPDLSKIPEVIRVEDMSFEGPMFHRSIVDKVGLPRRDFFVLCDDTEYAWRILSRRRRSLAVRLRSAHRAAVADRPEGNHLEKVLLQPQHSDHQADVSQEMVGRHRDCGALQPVDIEGICRQRIRYGGLGGADPSMDRFLAARAAGAIPAEAGGWLEAGRSGRAVLSGPLSADFSHPVTQWE